MFTDKRLSQAYRHAHVRYFDDQSKYVFFSDLHRGNDSVSDEFTRNQIVMLHALDYYYHNGYTYVEAGDGDELWEYRDFRDIRLAHGDVFTALKKFYNDRRMLVLYGNHNIRLKSRRFVKRHYYTFYDEYRQSNYNLFPGLKPYEALRLKHHKTGQEVFAVHGHQGDLMNDQLWPVSMFMLRYFWRYLHVVGFRNPSSPAKNLFKRHKIERKYQKWIQRHGHMLICGHTHRPRFPKGGELPYYNTGCCIHTKGISGIEISGGQIMLIDWRMKADADGVMRIIRTIVRGPEPIHEYHQRRHQKSDSKRGGFC